MVATFAVKFCVLSCYGYVENKTEYLLSTVIVLTNYGTIQGFFFVVQSFSFKDCSLSQLISFHVTYIYQFPASHSTWCLDLTEHGCIVSVQ